MTNAEMAKQALKERWVPISKTKNVQEIRDALSLHSCVFCIELSGCRNCPLHINLKCCDGLWAKFVDAYHNNNFLKAHNISIAICGLLSEIAESGK